MMEVSYTGSPAWTPRRAATASSHAQRRCPLHYRSARFLWLLVEAGGGLGSRLDSKPSAFHRRLPGLTGMSVLSRGDAIGTCGRAAECQWHQRRLRQRSVTGAQARCTASSGRRRLQGCLPRRSRPLTGYVTNLAFVCGRTRSAGAPGGACRGSS